MHRWPLGDRVAAARCGEDIRIDTSPGAHNRSAILANPVPPLARRGATLRPTTRSSGRAVA